MTICKQGAEDQPMEHSKDFTMLGKVSCLTCLRTQLGKLTRLKRLYEYSHIS